jgi:AAA family ATPase
VGGTFDVTPRLSGKKKSRQRFLVEKILPASQDKDMVIPYQFSMDCKIVIRDTQMMNHTNLPTSQLEIGFGSLKGMNKQLLKLEGILTKLSPAPILIIGPSGTGKSAVLEALSNGSWEAFRNWATFSITASTMSSTDSKVRASLLAIFSEASTKHPAVVLIDDLDLLVPGDAPMALAAALRDEIRNNVNKNVRIVASAKRLLDMHPSVAGVFRYNIELPVPTAAGRKEILKVYCESASDELLEHVSSHTHAFVPRDIELLCCAAAVAAMERRDNTHHRPVGRPSADSGPSDRILEEDFTAALRSVRPSAMGEIFLDVPNVRWRDIGGSESLKKELQRATGSIFKVSNTCSILLLLTMNRPQLKLRRYLRKIRIAEFSCMGRRAAQRLSRQRRWLLSRSSISSP